MKTNLKSTYLCLLLIAVAGCAHTKITTTEVNDGGVEKKTTLSAWAFFDSGNAMNKAAAKVGDKTSGITVGSISQEASGTNVTALVGVAAESFGKGLIQGAK